MIRCRLLNWSRNSNSRKPCVSGQRFICITLNNGGETRPKTVAMYQALGGLVGGHCHCCPAVCVVGRDPPPPGCCIGCMDLTAAVSSVNIYSCLKASLHFTFTFTISPLLLHPFEISSAASLRWIKSYSTFPFAAVSFSPLLIHSLCSLGEVLDYLTRHGHERYQSR